MMVCDIDNKNCMYYRNGNCTFEEYPRPKIVAVDLDGVIFKYDGWHGHNHFGEPIISRFWGLLLGEFEDEPKVVEDIEEIMDEIDKGFPFELTPYPLSRTGYFIRYWMPKAMHPKEALAEMKKRGWVVVIWTTRDNRERIGDELKKHNIPFDYINEHPWQPPDCSNKLYADEYIDDRGRRFWK